MTLGREFFGLCLKKLKKKHPKELNFNKFLGEEEVFFEHFLLKWKFYS
jgi:hypothetical protein